MVDAYWKKHRPPLVRVLGKKLQERLQHVSREPAPESWVELLQRLNAAEARQKRPPQR
jgi:hypothetical protein